MEICTQPLIYKKLEIAFLMTKENFLDEKYLINPYFKKHYINWINISNEVTSERH